VHVWHTRDHVLGLRALAGAGGGGPRLVRSWRRIGPPPPWERWLLGTAAGLLCASPAAAAGAARWRRGRPTAGAFGAVDLARFRPGRPDPGVRASLGLAPEHRVVAVAARVQPHRRFDLLLAAAERLFRQDPLARLLVVGRGTRRAELAERPAECLGIRGRIAFAGYRRGDYPDVLRAADVFTLLAPGSDGGCPALLEAAACGLPAVVPRRAPLGEIVVPGVTGLVVEESAGALAGAWGELLTQPERRLALGAGARRRAEERFAPDQLAAQADALYRAVL
jgi:alpha-1,6-mannosyltransferase